MLEKTYFSVVLNSPVPISHMTNKLKEQPFVKLTMTLVTMTTDRLDGQNRNIRYFDLYLET